MKTRNILEIETKVKAIEINKISLEIDRYGIFISNYIKNLETNILENLIVDIHIYSDNRFSILNLYSLYNPYESQLGKHICLINETIDF